MQFKQFLIAGVGLCGPKNEGEKNASVSLFTSNLHIKWAGKCEAMLMKLLDCFQALTNTACSLRWDFVLM